MRGRSCAGVRSCGRAGPPASAPPLRRRTARQPHALGASAGVRGHGAAGRAGGAAPATRPQAPFHIVEASLGAESVQGRGAAPSLSSADGARPPWATCERDRASRKGMGEAAEVTGDGGSAAGDGGARDARALRRGRRAPGTAAQHTAAGRRVRPGRAPTVTSPLSAGRADEKQFPASTEQMRERCARVGERHGGGGGGAARRRRQEGRAAAEGHAVVGAHGRAARGAVRGRGRGAALRHGAAPRAAARRVTRRAPPHCTTPRCTPLGAAPCAPTLTFHSRDEEPHTDLLFIYSPREASAVRPCSSHLS